MQIKRVGQAVDSSPVGSRERAVFWSVVVGAVVGALAGYYAFLSSVPDCGPPRNTTLGHIYWLVPLALLAAQSGVIAGTGWMTRRSPTLTIVVVLLAGAIAAVGGASVFLHFFVAGNCGE